jgi:hypothetical protein
MSGNENSCHDIPKNNFSGKRFRIHETNVSLHIITTLSPIYG